MTILVIAEHNDAQLKSSTLNALKAAFELGSDVDVLVAGQSCEGAVKQAAAVAGVRKVLVAQGEAFNHCLPEALTDAVLAAQQAGGYSHILFTAGTSGKAAMPRTAAKLGVSALTEIAGVISADTFKRYIYAGGVLATVKTTATPVVASVRATSFEAVSAEGGNAAVETLAVTPSSRGFKFVSVEEVASDRPDLLTAKRVVAGGRGLFDEEGFAALDRLARALGVRWMFHGHQHEDRVYGKHQGVTVRAVGYRGIVNLKGDVIVPAQMDPREAAQLEAAYAWVSRTAEPLDPEPKDAGVAGRPLLGFTARLELPAPVAPLVIMRSGPTEPSPMTAVGEAGAKPAPAARSRTAGEGTSKRRRPRRKKFHRIIKKG